MKIFLAGLILLLSLTAAALFPNEKEAKVVFHQKFIEGKNQAAVNSDVNIADIDEVFWFVFSNLDRNIIIYPSSNYYYFKFVSGGKEYRGNIGFSPTDRNSGFLNFVYYEFTAPVSQNKSIKARKYGPADGVFIRQAGNGQYLVTYRAKSVIFGLYPLKQNPPRMFTLKEGESFVERTFDESGYQFFLIFNTAGNYFMWVLNEEQRPPDTLEIYANLTVGKKSGFVFYKDGARKILVGIKAGNMEENNYYDGPHDQLADNYAEESRVSDYIQLAYPRTRGKIDKYGWFTDGQPVRFALAPYYLYSSLQELQEILKSCRNEDFYICITNNRNRN